MPDSDSAPTASTAVTISKTSAARTSSIRFSPKASSCVDTPPGSVIQLRTFRLAPVRTRYPPTLDFTVRSIIASQVLGSGRAFIARFNTVSDTSTVPMLNTRSASGEPVGPRTCALWSATNRCRNAVGVTAVKSNGPATVSLNTASAPSTAISWYPCRGFSVRNTRPRKSSAPFLYTRTQLVPSLR